MGRSSPAITLKKSPRDLSPPGPAPSPVIPASNPCGNVLANLPDVLSTSAKIPSAYFASDGAGTSASEFCSIKSSKRAMDGCEIDTRISARTR